MEDADGWFSLADARPIYLDAGSGAPRPVSVEVHVSNGLPGFTVMEFLQGARNKAELARFRKLLAPFVVYWPTAEDCARAVETCARTCLTHDLSVPDIMIAECAIGLDATLCTFNVKHFRAIPGLVTERPYLRT